MRTMLAQGRAVAKPSLNSDANCVSKCPDVAPFDTDSWRSHFGLGPAAGGDPTVGLGSSVVSLSTTAPCRRKLPK